MLTKAPTFKVNLIKQRLHPRKMSSSETIDKVPHHISIPIAPVFSTPEENSAERREDFWKDANRIVKKDEHTKDDGTRVTTKITTTSKTHEKGETTVKTTEINTVEADTDIIEETVYDCLCCCPCLRRLEREARANYNPANNNSS